MLTFTSDRERVEYFFAEPSVPPEAHQRGGVFSVLYLLRRELMETMGYDPTREPESLAWHEGARNRLFASLVLMFTGFDLLAKFDRRDSEGVGDRFRCFIRSDTGAQLTADAAELFWAVRNSMVHAFNTPDAGALARLGMRSIALAQRRIHETTLGPGYGVVTTNGETAVVYMDGVFQALMDAMERYRDSLHDPDYPDAPQRFVEMFNKYGTVQMRPA